MTTTLTMKDLTIGTLVTVNDSTARNPGGYGRITRRSPKHGLVHVDSGEFPGQEVTGWYPIENVGLYAPTPEPAAAITDLKRIDHEIDRSSGRPQSEYWGYYDGELIGVRSTYSACEQMLDEYAYNLLSDAPSVVYARPAEEVEPIAAEPESFPFSKGQHIRHAVTGETGVVLGWRLQERRGKEPRYLMGIRCTTSELTSTLDGWEPVAPEPYDDTLHIPARDLDGQCTCGQALDSMGLCGCLSDQDAAEITAVLAEPVNIPYAADLLFHWWRTDPEIFSLLLMTMDTTQLEATATAFADYLNMRLITKLQPPGLRSETVLRVWSRMIEQASPPLLAA